MTKILIGMLSLALVGTGGLVAAVEGLGGSDPLPSVSLPDAGTTGTTTGATTGTTTGTTTVGTTTGTTTGENDDVSGPCDEAEHANDPRCTGAAVADDHRDDRGGDHRGRDGSSGPGSGRNEDGSDQDRSGPGRGGDDHDDDGDDNSGHGSDD